MASKKKPPATKRKSGGARAVEAKHRKRDAERRRAELGQTDTGAGLARLLQQVPPVDADARTRIKFLAAACTEAVVDAIRDVGLPPEQRREQIVRMAEKALKVLEPAKLAEELDELYAEFQKLEETVRVGAGGGSQEQQRAGDDAKGKDRGAPPRPDIG